MMSLNRYRLKHLKRNKHPGATRASKLLESPDKLIGIILIGNNFTIFLAASIATSISIMLLGEPAPLTTAIILTLIVLIFAEVTPKTIAALYPEKIAYPSSLLLAVLLKILYPAVWMVNFVSNALVRLIGFRPETDDSHQQLSPDELRTVVHESGARIPQRRQGMLLNILDLEKVTVNDILVPRNDVLGIDIGDDLDEILDQIASSQHTRMPVFKEDVDKIIGMLHLRNAAKFLTEGTLSKAAMLQELEDPYFVPENTPLQTQLYNFQLRKERIGLVVDEYGDIEGIVTLEDILEEIVGEFTTDLAAISTDIYHQDDGSYMVDGGAHIRLINRSLGWDLPQEGPKTLNGLITEYLENIPESNVCMVIGDYRIEIVQIQDNMIRTARILEPAEQEG